jgi:hypothetical protein
MNYMFYGRKNISIYYTLRFHFPYDPKYHELFAILYFLSKIIMQVPFRNQIENEAVQDSNLIKASIGGSLHSGINTINDKGSFDSDNKF